MVVTTVLWRYWQEQQYEEAITEVCALLDVKEESFSSDQELLAAAGDPERPIPGSFPAGEAENLANLALFGCSCCNRLAEKHVRNDWRVAAHWCALARCLEAAGGNGGNGCGAGPWAMARFKRLFHAAEAIRVAGKDVQKNDETGRLTLPDYHLRASQKCLRECESIWMRWPSCTSSPESIYTCLAEVCWQLKDMESVRSTCRKALSLMSTDRLKPAKVYACMFVLWVFQSAALDVFSWREVRAALHCARDMFERLQASGLPPQDLRPHARILKRLQRSGSVVPMAPVDLAEAQEELGLNYSTETSDISPVHGRSNSDRKSEVVMTDLEVGPVGPVGPETPPSAPPVRFEDQCAEIMAFLESIDVAEALRASRKKGCLDNLLSAAEAAIKTDMDKGLDLQGLDRTWEAPKVEGEVPGSNKTPRRWKRRCSKPEMMEEHPRPWLSVPFVIEAWQCHSVDGRAEGQDAVSTPSVTAWSSRLSPDPAELPKAEPPSPATPPGRSVSETAGGAVSRHRVALKPAVPLAPRRQGAAGRSMESISQQDHPAKPRTGRSFSLHDELECQPPREKRERRKAPLPKWSPRPSSGYTRPAASLRPAVPGGCRPFVSGQSAECSTNANISCSSGSTECNMADPAPVAAENLDSYMQQHQIQPFLQEMLTELFAVLPEDPYEYLTYHLAAKRPVRPPQDQNLIQSGVLWVLLPGSNPMSLEHWRLRRCWLTDQGVICVSNEAAEVGHDDSGSMVISPPQESAPQEPLEKVLNSSSQYDYSLEKGAIHRELDEDEAARPFAFTIAVKPGPLAHKGDKEKSGRWILQLAASSQEQRSEWFNAFAPFSQGDAQPSMVPPKDLPVLSRPTVSQQCNKASSTSLSIFSTVTPEPVDVDATNVPWAFRGIRRQIEPPHLHFGHIPRRPAFDVH
eukprot:s412_g6.t2